MRPKLFFLVFILLVVSCETDKVEIDLDNSTHVHAGLYNSDFYYYKFQEDSLLELNYKRCGSSIALGSFDIDFDQTIDLALEEFVYVHNIDTFNKCCPPPFECYPPLNYTTLLIHDSSNFQLCGKEPDTSLAYRNNVYIDTLNYNIRLDTMEYWYDNSKLTYLFDLKRSNAGPWRTITEDKYVGLRKPMEGIYKYGWIKIGNNNNRIILKEMAFQK